MVVSRIPIVRNSWNLIQGRNFRVYPVERPWVSGMPSVYHKSWDRDFDIVADEESSSDIPRGYYGTPGHIPPEITQQVKHTLYLPPQYYPWLKKLGEDTPELKPYMDKAIKGDFTYLDFEEMFYEFAKPLKIYRSRIPVPYRTAEEQKKADEIALEMAWHSYRQRVLGYHNTNYRFRDHLLATVWGLFFGYVMSETVKQYRIDMKLYYLEAPEHKINWVKPRGDL